MKVEDILKIARRTIEIELEAIRNINLDENFIKSIEIIYNCKGKVILTGIGKSGHIAHKISSTLSSTGTPSVYLHPAEAIHGDLGILDKDDVLIAISYSGETDEIINILPYVKFLGIPVISITGKEDSSLSRLSDVVITVKIDREACPLNLAPTSSTTAILVLGDAIAMVLLELKGFNEEKFARLHPGGLLGKKLRKVEDLMHKDKEIPIVYENASMKEAIIEITSKGFGATAVLNRKGDIVGIITDGDLRRYIEKGNDLNNGSVQLAMTRDPKTIRYDLTAGEALSIMEKYKITVLLVVDDNKKLVGIIHLHDILRAGII
jgi:arabinose-5-phosphate isomerase